MSCHSLFGIRNALDPKNPNIPRINEQPREVGCYTSSSERTDT
jgi:hypothetical protein